MSEIYNLTKQIHEIIPKVSQKHDLILCWYIITNEYGRIKPLTTDQYAARAVTEEDLLEDYPEQIQDVLADLSDVLGDAKVNTLRSRWLYGFNSFFKREPGKVLTELLEILKKLNK